MAGRRSVANDRGTATSCTGQRNSGRPAYDDCSVVPLIVVLRGHAGPAHPRSRRRSAACRIARTPACSDLGCRGASRTYADRTGSSMAWSPNGRYAAAAIPKSTSRDSETPTTSAIPLSGGPANGVSRDSNGRSGARSIPSRFRARSARPLSGEKGRPASGSSRRGGAASAPVSEDFRTPYAATPPSSPGLLDRYGTHLAVHQKWLP